MFGSSSRATATCGASSCRPITRASRCAGLPLPDGRRSPGAASAMSSEPTVRRSADDPGRRPPGPASEEDEPSEARPSADKDDPTLGPPASAFADDRGFCRSPDSARTCRAHPARTRSDERKAKFYTSAIGENVPSTSAPHTSSRRPAALVVSVGRASGGVALLGTLTVASRNLRELDYYHVIDQGTRSSTSAPSFPGGLRTFVEKLVDGPRRAE